MKLIQLLAALTLALCSLQSLAEQKQVFGDYEVHYILLNSTELPPQAAEAYDIPRSSLLAFLNISVLEKQKGNNIPKPIPALVTASYQNLIGQTKKIELREIRETGAIYYISTFPFSEDEMLRFRFEIKTHADQAEPFVAKHNQKLYREN